MLKLLCIFKLRRGGSSRTVLLRTKRQHNRAQAVPRCFLLCHFDQRDKS